MTEEVTDLGSLSSIDREPHVGDQVLGGGR